MFYSEKTISITNFVCDAFAGRKDKLGMPYIWHLFAVAEGTGTEAETCVALLHDYAEDITPDWTDAQVEEKLYSIGISYEAIEAILMLRHKKNVPYMAYIRQVSENTLARRIKILDLKHNMDPDRLKLLDKEEQERLLGKYKPAMEYLEEFE